MEFEEKYAKFDEEMGEFIKNIENHPHNKFLQLQSNYFCRMILNFQAELQRLFDGIQSSAMIDDMINERNQLSVILKEIYNYTSPLEDNAAVFQNKIVAREILGKMPWLRQHMMRLHSALKKRGLIKK